MQYVFMLNFFTLYLHLSRYTYLLFIYLQSVSDTICTRDLMYEILQYMRAFKFNSIGFGHI